MGRKLYVGNLSYNVQDTDLEALFAHYGPVQSAQVIMDRAARRHDRVSSILCIRLAKAVQEVRAASAQSDAAPRRATVREPLL